MSRWIRVQTSIFDDPLFAGRPYGKTDAFLWLSQVWDGTNIHLISERLGWPKQNVWKFLRDAISHGLLDAARFYEAEQFYRKLARRPAIPSDVKAAVAIRDGDRCRYCGETSGPFHFDHVKPWSKGGEHISSNLVVSCRTCNLRKKDKTLKELGWRL